MNSINCDATVTCGEDPKISLHLPGGQVLTISLDYEEVRTEDEADTSVRILGHERWMRSQLHLTVHDDEVDQFDPVYESWGRRSPCDFLAEITDLVEHADEYRAETLAELDG